MLAMQQSVLAWWHHFYAGADTYMVDMHQSALAWMVPLVCCVLLLSCPASDTVCSCLSTDSQTLTFEMIKSDGDTTEAETVMSQEQRAIMEAAVSASVDHPNVVSCISRQSACDS